MTFLEIVHLGVATRVDYFLIQSSNPSHIERLKIMAIPSKETLQEIALKQEEEDAE